MGVSVKYLPPPEPLIPKGNPFHPAVTDLVIPSAFFISLASIFLGPVYFPSWHHLSLLMLYTYFSGVSFLNMVKNLISAQRVIRCVANYRQKSEKDGSDEILQYLHVFVIPNYGESVSLLQSTIQRLASHKGSKSNYVVVLAMEMHDPSHEERASILMEMFQKKFFAMLCTNHEVQPHETKGKGSNVSYSVRCVHQWVKSQKFDQEYVIVTVMDADSDIPEVYINEVDSTATKKRTEMIEFYRNQQSRSGNSKNPVEFSPPSRTAKPDFTVPVSQPYTLLQIFSPFIFFAKNGEEVPAPVRLCDAMWSMVVMQNLSNIRGINFPISTYSLTLSLANLVHYWDTTPNAIGEDYHMYLKCFFLTRTLAKATPIYVPINITNVQAVQSPPLSVSSALPYIKCYVQNMYARFEQGRRHLDGLPDSSYSLQFLLSIFGLLPSIDATRVVSAEGKLQPSSIYDTPHKSTKATNQPGLPLPPLPSKSSIIFDHFMVMTNLLEAHLILTLSLFMMLVVPITLALYPSFFNDNGIGTNVLSYISMVNGLNGIWLIVMIVQYEILHRLLDASGIFSSPSSPTRNSKTKTRHLRYLLDYMWLPITPIIYSNLPAASYCIGYFVKWWKGDWSVRYIVASKGDHGGQKDKMCLHEKSEIKKDEGRDAGERTDDEWVVVGDKGKKAGLRSRRRKD
ncbi:hypothetical protein BKA69DRAFT_1128483 [Paraphysoderma sedebokerense]|nr:hypothetical protein BKA69DRAFT_1128483 [Paraphysoderma sedebokerense]